VKLLTTHIYREDEDLRDEYQWTGLCAACPLFEINVTKSSGQDTPIGLRLTFLLTDLYRKFTLALGWGRGEVSLNVGRLSEPSKERLARK